MVAFRQPKDVEGNIGILCSSEDGNRCLWVAAVDGDVSLVSIFREWNGLPCEIVHA